MTSRNVLLAKAELLRSALTRNRHRLGSLTRPPLTADNTLALNLSDPDNIVSSIDPIDAAACWKAIDAQLKEHGKLAAVGGYGEKRTAYRINPDLFGRSENERCIHLGIDIWLAPGTTIHAPLQGIVHSFADNAGLGNYGPTIILEHELDNIRFYSLYGHLNRESLIGLAKGRPVGMGDALGTVGQPFENGNWVPHLHYQLMADMLDHAGDFPGVCTESDAQFYLALCPEPVAL